MPFNVFAGNVSGEQALARTWPFSIRTSENP
jgi:hypothetical protein